MTPVTGTALDAWNVLEPEQALALLISCCASQRWARELVALRPFAHNVDLYDQAERIWAQTDESDWIEAFRAHPRIGERKAAHATARSQAWSGQEQASAAVADPEILTALANANRRYEELFGFTYIVCATGKSAEEMLLILDGRLKNDRPRELLEAMKQQGQITQLRLRKWLEA